MSPSCGILESALFEPEEANEDVAAGSIIERDLEIKVCSRVRVIRSKYVKAIKQGNKYRVRR